MRHMHLGRRRLRRPLATWATTVLAFAYPPLVVQRTFGWISKKRRCVRDYETLPEHHEAMLHLAMVMTMSRRVAPAGHW
jgi:hypothetical protein